MKGWLVALVVLLGIPSAASSQDAQDPGTVHEMSAQAYLLQAKATTVPVVLLGIVEVLDPIKGALVLGHGDGTRSYLTAAPGLLQKIQVGDPVNVVVDGSIVRTVEPLGAPSPRA